MAARPVWKGQLRLSLVAIPVEMYSATKSGARISFRQIHAPSGKPVKYEKVVAGVGPVKPADIMKGYEFSKDEFVLIDADEIDAVRLESKRTMELAQFVGACEIPPLYFNKPYYLVPADELAEEAYCVLRDALRDTEKTGLGQITLRGLEYVAAVRPCGDGLLLETLHYADEIRNAAPIFSGISEKKADKDLRDVATTLIERKTAPFNADAFVDHYSETLKQLVEAKRKNRSTRKITTGESEPRSDGNVIDLMAALKSSLEKTGGSAKKRSQPTTRKKKSA